LKFQHGIEIKLDKPHFIAGIQIQKKIILKAIIQIKNKCLEVSNMQNIVICGSTKFLRRTLKKTQTWEFT